MRKDKNAKIVTDVFSGRNVCIHSKWTNQGAFFVTTLKEACDDPISALFSTSINRTID